MEECDLIIVGAGPTGLFATFCAGLREINSITLEGLDAVGGQIIKFYPIKKVYDVEGIPEIIGTDLADALYRQAKRFGSKMLVNSKVTDIKPMPDGRFTIEVNGTDAYVAKAVLLSTGIGELMPNKLNVQGENDYADKGVYYTVSSVELFKDKTVAVVGGGDAGFDFANQIVDAVKKIYVLEYADVLKAAERSVKDLTSTGKAEIIFNVAVQAVNGDGSAIKGLRVLDRVKNQTKDLQVDAVIVAIGHKAQPNAFKSVVFDTYMNKIKVDDDCATSVKGIFAAGDASISKAMPKAGLLAVGGAEAYEAINIIKKYLNPEASIFGGHSTSMNL